MPDTYTAVVNNIPSEAQLRSDLGYSGWSRHFKKKNPLLSKIFTRFKRAQSWRNTATHEAIANLRHARKACNQYIRMHQWDLTPTVDRITQVRNALNDRIEAVANQLYVNVLSSNPKQFQLAGIERRKAAFALEDEVDAILMGGNHSGFRTLDGEYHTERANKGHFSGNLISAWQRANTTLTLQKWGDTVWKWRIQDGQKGAYEVAWNEGRGVRYLDPTERQAYQVTIRGGQMRDAANNLLHTGNMRSLTGRGEGWGIYVMDFYGNMYVNSHERDRFHHSSFLSGAPIASAGEIAVNGGRVVGLTNKTGHYKAGPKELKTALDALARGGIFLNGVAVMDQHQLADWFDGLAVSQAEGDVTGVTAAPIAAPLRVAA